jgi:serine protease inhibitor
MLTATAGRAGALEEASLRPAGDVEIAGAKEDVEAVARANNTFACELYGKLCQQPGNLFLSPASIHTALGMTYAGAAGRTAEQMAAALHFDLPSDRLHAALGGLARELNHPAMVGDEEPYRLIVSNALWMQKGCPFRQEFTTLVKAHYDTGLNEVDFSAPEPARKIINDWVYKATQDKIEDLIPPRDPDPRDPVGAHQRHLLQEHLGRAVHPGRHAGGAVPPGGRRFRGGAVDAPVDGHRIHGDRRVPARRSAVCRRCAEHDRAAAAPG